ncbi:hypothetical protein DOY81_010946, partial [Sarcophaga bullata]
KSVNNYLQEELYLDQTGNDNSFNENEYISENESYISISNENDSDASLDIESEEAPDIREELAKWSIKFNISFTAVNALLELLLKCNIKVPKDARTLLKTPSTVVERKVGDGKYIHYGLKNGLTDFLVSNHWKLSTMSLDFGIDGLPLFKSSSKQVWPILASVVEANYVFLVGVYEGIAKPNSSNDFLVEFISELKNLIQQGLVFDDKYLKIVMSQTNMFNSTQFQYQQCNNSINAQNVSTIQNDSLQNLIIELRNEIKSLKTEVLEMRKDINELKDCNKRSVTKLTE